MNIYSATAKIVNLGRGCFFRFLIILGGGRCGPGLRVERGFRLRHGPHKGIKIGKNVYVGLCSVFDCPSSGQLIIGDNVTFTHGVFISAIENVTIGDDALIGEYVSIRDANHQAEISSVPIRNQPMLAKRCVIGSNVWVGRGCAILSGARLESGCVIGANSVVNGRVPNDAIAVGSPSRVIATRQKPANQVE